MKTLDIDECAEFLKINRTTASELAASGELPGAKIGRAWVFIEEDLVEYLRGKVRQQQRERQTDTDLSEKSRIKTINALTTLPTIKQSKRSRRNALPVLPVLPSASPHLVCESTAPQISVPQ